MAETPKKLYRLPQRGMIAGVCAGLADYFDIDVSVIRVLFVLAALVTGGLALVAYIVLAVVLPRPALVGKPGKRTVAGNDIEENVQSLAGELRANESVGTLRNLLALGLIILGIWLLIGQFFPGWLDIRWSLLWPIFLVLIGLVLLVRGRR
jgi:phage shock protein C